MFDFPLSVPIYTALATAVLLWLGTGRQPLDPLYRIVRKLLTSRKYVLFLAATVSILLVNTFELKWEDAYGVRYDLTGPLTGWEGDWHVWLQTLLQSGTLTTLCAFFYVVVFQSVIIASLGIYSSGASMKMYYAFCTALLLNYAIALPMYWFIPVNEAWFAHSQIRFLMLDAFPSFERDYRGLSGIDNCFPSLHTSISVTMALLAARSGIRRWAIFAGINAAVIVFAIFYLGIHWLTDAIGGILLAAFSVWVGMKVGEKADRSAFQPASEASAQTTKAV